MTTKGSDFELSPNSQQKLLLDNALRPEEVESVLWGENTTFDVSDSSGRPVAFGSTDTGRFIVVVFEILNLAHPLIIRPITAYEVPEPTK